MDPVSLEVMKNAFTFVPEEMGQALRRTAYSPNIKERMDASCAIFDVQGRMVAQAEHIPVHLGSMPLAIRAIRELQDPPEEGDQVILNDPYQGGSHLNDVTLIKPVFWEGDLVGYTVNKAHHADVGGTAPGSMPTGSRTLFEEGVVLSPQKFLLAGTMDPLVQERIRKGMRDPRERMGDLSAQVAANNTGDRRFRAYLTKYGRPAFEAFADEIMDYSERRVRRALELTPDGTYSAEDQLDDDGVLDEPLPLRVQVDLHGDAVTVDFSGTAETSAGNVNAPYAVTLSSAYYVLRTLTDPAAPPNEGGYRPIRVVAPEDTLLNPRKPAAVAAGNVETSQRVVDVLFKAFASALPDRVPAQSQGTMNNLLIGGRKGDHEFAYYETIGGGEGALPYRDGMSGIQTHMTNTLNTPIEALETAYPFRVEAYHLRPESGGKGRFHGGSGIVRSIRFLGERGTVSLISERRRFPPQGLQGGSEATTGQNTLVRDGERLPLPSKLTMGIRRDDIIRVETPGGGGWGIPE